MTSFLQRLALRDSGALPVLKPRLPGLFEPPAGVAPLPVGDDGGAEDAAVMPAAPEQGAPRAMRSAWPAAPRPAPRDAADERPAGVAQPVAPPAIEPARPGATAPALPRSEPSAQSATVRPSPRSEPSAQSATALRPSIAAPVIEAAAAALAAHASLPRRHTALPAPPLTQAPAAPHRSPIVDDAGALRHGPAPTAPAPALTPNVPPAPDAVRAARAAVQQAPAAPLPTVQVTIGRVEVRATQAPAAPARQAGRVQPTSLDEYLRQRDGRQEGRR